MARERHDRVLDTIRDIRIPMAHSERHDRVLDTIRLIRTARAASLRRRVLSLEAQLRAVDLAAVKLATRRSLAAVAEAAHQDVAEALALEEALTVSSREAALLVERHPPTAPPPQLGARPLGGDLSERALDGQLDGGGLATVPTERLASRDVP